MNDRNIYTIYLSIYYIDVVRIERLDISSDGVALVRREALNWQPIKRATLGAMGSFIFHSLSFFFIFSSTANR